MAKLLDQLQRLFGGAVERPSPAAQPPASPVPAALPKFVAIDCETTGLSAAAGHRIVSLALVRADTRGVIDDFLYLVFNPERRSDPIAEKIHGFNHWHLRHQPRFAEYAHDILRFIGASDLVGHNVEFDLTFLLAEMRRCGLKLPPNDYYCTMKAGELRWGRRLSLENAISRCCAEDLSDLRKHGHDALIDACMAAGLYAALSSGEAKISFLLRRPGNEIAPPPLDYIGDMSRAAVIARGKALTRQEADAAFAKYESRTLAARALGVSRARLVRVLTEAG